MILLYQAERLRSSALLQQVVLLGIGISFLSVPAFHILHANDSHSYRMEKIGRHVFKTYYGHSDTYLLYALQMIPDKPELYKERKIQIRNDLLPFAVRSSDPKYATLLIDDAIYKYIYEEDFSSALDVLEIALEYDPESITAHYHLTEVLILIEDYSSAYDKSILPMINSYPDFNSALTKSLYCAVKSNRMGDASNLCDEYVPSEFEDEEILQICRALRIGSDQNTVLDYFK